MLRAFLFDFDGVIVHSEPLHFEVFGRVLREEGIGLTRTEYDAVYLGKDDRTCFLTALQRAGRPATEESAHALVQRKAAYFEAARHHLTALPGAEAFVHRAGSHYPLAVGSGALLTDIEFVLAKLELRDCFRVVVSAEDCAHSKPHPECFLTCLERLNDRSADAIRPEQCLVIEDSLSGVAAAQAAGMRCLAVANSYPPRELRDADLTVASLEGLDPARLATMW